MRGLFFALVPCISTPGFARAEEDEVDPSHDVALQSEYRWLANDSWIFTGFAGFGEVAKTFGDFGNNLLPAAGIGARFILFRKHRI